MDSRLSPGDALGAREDAQNAKGQLSAFDATIERRRPVELIHGDVEPAGLTEAQGIRPREAVIANQGFDQGKRINPS
ncbi:hypothetical protein [Thiococcus pfennigii]|uniref:hypothetical protein n=1 Tax=Thiococcus pfennigii TaxID=1057 RepID=UPI00190545B1|nr:hypothetical protein [Thiococcus pfennigii]MBK1699394.1 hypothetical protein [Thiococcus pfennigii]